MKSEIARLTQALADAQAERDDLRRNKDPLGWLAIRCTDEDFVRAYVNEAEMEKRVAGVLADARRETFEAVRDLAVAVVEDKQGRVENVSPAFLPPKYVGYDISTCRMLGNILRALTLADITPPAPEGETK